MIKRILTNIEIRIYRNPLRFICFLLAVAIILFVLRGFMYAGYKDIIQKKEILADVFVERSLEIYETNFSTKPENDTIINIREMFLRNVSLENTAKTILSNNKSIAETDLNDPVAFAECFFSENDYAEYTKIIGDNSESAEK